MLVVNQCIFCKHFKTMEGPYRGIGKGYCSVFPQGIPDEIFLNDVDHRYPYPGDNGGRFETDDAEIDELQREMFMPEEECEEEGIEDDEARPDTPPRP